MSNFIQLLPDNIANQIAAGEVIQRPASVVKELIENAIDAGSTKIIVNIKDSGKTLIQLIDNGTGMSMADAKLCFERHATSKIRSAEDLFALTTKGFRGEALASISSIAHVILKTRTCKAEVGSSITIEGSEIKEETEVVCPIGTSFDVKNLFYNVPARRNFLKSEKVEFGHITDEFERVALAHPSIAFTLHHNGTEVYNLPEAILRKRIVDVLGRKANDRLVPIEESTEIVSLKGFVLKPEFAKKSRGEQFFFVNDRFFKSPYFNHSVNKAFEGLLKEKSFPSYFLYLTVDPKKIDVNVHPTKTEIKFEEEKFIYSILLSSIRQALGKYNISPTLDFERETSFDLPGNTHLKEVIEPKIQVDTNYNPFNSHASRSSAGKKSENFSSAIVSQGFGADKNNKEDWENFYNIEEDKSTTEVTKPDLIPEESVEKASSFILKGNYIFSPSKSGIMVIHARRAVEQIVYSSMINSFISNPIESQTLLFPLEHEITKKEGIEWSSNNSMLIQLGFNGVIKDDLLSLHAVPCVLQEEALTSSLGDIISIITHKEIEKGDLAHNLIHSIARRASQKNLNLNTNEAIQSLIDQLFQCENHTFSPSNKKIIETITIDELTKKFDKK